MYRDFLNIKHYLIELTQCFFGHGKKTSWLTVCISKSAIKSISMKIFSNIERTNTEVLKLYTQITEYLVL
jgi:hypothetical protein